MFRDRRFLGCLRADAVRSPRHPVDGHSWAKPRFWRHVFDIPRFRLWYNCNREFEVWGRVVLYLAQWYGWVGMEPFLGFFHQPSKSLVVAARCGHIFATFRLAVCASYAPLSACRAWPATCSRRLGREGLCSSFTPP